MSKTSGYTGAIVVAAVLVTPAHAQTPVPVPRPSPTVSLQIVVNDQSGTALEGVGIGVSHSRSAFSELIPSRRLRDATTAPGCGRTSLAHGADEILPERHASGRSEDPSIPTPAPPRNPRPGAAAPSPSGPPGADRAARTAETPGVVPSSAEPGEDLIVESRRAGNVPNSPSGCRRLVRQDRVGRAEIDAESSACASQRRAAAVHAERADHGGPRIMRVAVRTSASALIEHPRHWLIDHGRASGSSS